MDLIYYNEKGEVKNITFEEDHETGFPCVTPQENYFIKGLVLNDGSYLTAYQIQSMLNADLTPLESHFLTCRYGFFPELSKHNYRLENVTYYIPTRKEGDFANIKA